MSHFLESSGLLCCSISQRDEQGCGGGWPGLHGCPAKAPPASIRFAGLRAQSPHGEQERGLGRARLTCEGRVGWVAQGCPSSRPFLSSLLCLLLPIPLLLGLTETPGLARAHQVLRASNPGLRQRQSPEGLRPGQGPFFLSGQV